MFLIYYLFLLMYINSKRISNLNKMMENSPLNYVQLKSEYEKMKAENNQLKIKIQEYESNSPFAKALERKIVNSMLGREYIEGEDLGDVIQRDIRNNPHLCDNKRYSWNCCFAKDTKIIVNENNKIVEKNISDIKKDDLILTLINGEKKFTKVKYTKEYDDEFEFYEFKCMRENKIKTITVTGNHIMIVYNKNMDELKYKTADQIVKNDNYFQTTDGLYEVIEINIFKRKFKYALGVDEGAIIADNILVSCLNMNDVSKNLSLKDMVEKYKVNIL